MGVKYRCDECEYESGSKECLKVHKESKHLGIGYKCGDCDYQSSSKFNLSMHNQRINLKIKEKCDICGDEFSPPYVKKHIKTHMGKNLTNATNATLLLSGKAVRENFPRLAVDKTRMDSTPLLLFTQFRA